MDARTLAARTEIGDVIRLSCHVLDRHRWDLMDDVYHDDGTVRYSLRDNVQPYRQWVAYAQVAMSAFPCTLHQVGNMLIDIDGDTAWSETYVTATHRIPPTAPKDSYWLGREKDYDGVGTGRYVDHFECRDGVWKIVQRVAFIEWRHDRPADDGDLSKVPGEFRGHWGDADPSRSTVAWRLDRQK